MPAQCKRTHHPKKVDSLPKIRKTSVFLFNKTRRIKSLLRDPPCSKNPFLMAENENENVFIKCVDCKQRSKLTKWSPWCLSLFLSLSYLSHSLNTRTDSCLLLSSILCSCISPPYMFLTQNCGGNGGKSDVSICKACGRVKTADSIVYTLVKLI